MFKQFTPACGAAAVALCAGPALAQSCTPHWSGEFRYQQLLGEVHALTVHDDGGGPALYAGGTITEAAGFPAGCLAKYDGVTWSPLGQGITGSAGTAPSVVYALTSFEPAGERVLVAGGLFAAAGGSPAPNIAVWDGVEWGTLGSGVGGAVRALAAYPAGKGARLYAGGGFSSAGAVKAAGIAQWDGQEWGAVGGGLAGSGSAVAYALAVFDDGSGECLFVGGRFAAAGGIPANNIARWDGTKWSALNSGLTGSGATVRVLRPFGAPGAQGLYAGGSFNTAGGTPAWSLARWTGREWLAVAPGSVGAVVALEEFDEGAGPRLFASTNSTTGGQPAGYLFRLGNGTWEQVTSVGGSLRALRRFTDPEGAGLFIGGAVSSVAAAPDLQVTSVAKWDGSDWHAVRRGRGIEGGRVYALAHLDAGDGEALWAGGNFKYAGGIPARGIARRGVDGQWSALGTGIKEHVLVIDAFDDGSGRALYAGGWFFTVGGQPLKGIARWSNGRWSDVGGGLTSPAPYVSSVWALAVYDDGSGPALYAGGSFDAAGGRPIRALARWDGRAWSSAGSGLHSADPDLSVGALVVHNDGGGARLYVGGRFETAGGAPALNVARWDGKVWAPLGPGLSGAAISSAGRVHTMRFFDDGSGPSLFAGGYFDRSGATVVERIARWNGASWTPVGGGFPTAGSSNSWVDTLTVHDDGSGDALYAGGRIPWASGAPAGHAVRWDGSGWAPFGGDAADAVQASASVSAGPNVGLWLGGHGLKIGGLSSAGIARWIGCPTCLADCDASGTLTPADFACFQSQFVAGSPYADCNADGALTVADFGCFQTRFVAGCP